MPPKSEKEKLLLFQQSDQLPVLSLKKSSPPGKTFTIVSGFKNGASTCSPGRHLSIAHLVFGTHPMPQQPMAKRLLASLHTPLSGAMPLVARVLRIAILPEKVPAAGVVILRDGDPAPPEVWLSPPSYYYEHRAEIEVVVDGNRAARDAAFDDLRLAIGAALGADRTLGGLCDYITPEAPEPVLLTIGGVAGLKAAAIPVILAYVTTDPLL